MIPFLVVLSASSAQAADESLLPEPSPPAASSSPDRSAPPAVPVPPVLELPAPQIHPLGPGVSAWHVPLPGARKVAVEVVFGRGMVELLGFPEPTAEGAGALASAAAGGLDGAAFTDRCDRSEVELSSYLGAHQGGVSMLVPRENLQVGLELASQVVRAPDFPRREVRRWVLDELQFLRTVGPTSADLLASSALAYSWFPADHPYGARPSPSQLRASRGLAMGEIWGRLTQESPATVVVVGDVAWEEIEPALTAMMAGLGREGAPATELEVVPPSQTQVLAVDLPGKKQASLRVRLAAPAQDHPDHPAMVVGNFVLGGHFLSRLNANLREEKGWTYGAGSRYSSGETWGQWTVSVAVKTKDAGAALREIEQELLDLEREAITPVELESARRTMLVDWNRTPEEASRLAGAHLRALDLRTDVAGLRERERRVSEVTAAQVREAASRWLSPSAPRLWVVVGDRAALEPQLLELGLPVEWVAPTQVILGRF